jgi:hypothetical protein
LFGEDFLTRVVIRLDKFFAKLGKTNLVLGRVDELEDLCRFDQ